VNETIILDSIQSFFQDNAVWHCWMSESRKANPPKPTKSPEVTRPQQMNNQLQNGTELRDLCLGETSQKCADRRQRDEQFLQVLTTNDSNLSSSSLPRDLSMTYASDESADLEIQAWNLMWTHIISMISQVIECPNVRVTTGNEKRSALMDLIGRLCQAADDCGLVKKKYQRCRQALRKLKAQGETLLQEVQGNKEMIEKRLRGISMMHDDHLSQQIRHLEELLKRQLESQTEFLREQEHFECKSLSPHRRTFPTDDEPPPKRSQTRTTAKEDVRPPKPRRAASTPDASEKGQEPFPSRMQRTSAEREADGLLEEGNRPKQNGTPKPSCRFGHHLKELVDLANHLRDDYIRLDEYFGGDLSIEQLSHLNDSLVSEEHGFATMPD
jgi:hypothetical protein